MQYSKGLQRNQEMLRRKDLEVLAITEVLICYLSVVRNTKSLAIKFSFDEQCVFFFLPASKCRLFELQSSSNSHYFNIAIFLNHRSNHIKRVLYQSKLKEKSCFPYLHRYRGQVEFICRINDISCDRQYISTKTFIA